MNIALASFVYDVCSSVNQYRNQRPYSILSISGIVHMEVGKGSNKSKDSVMYSYDFKLPFVLVIQHGRKSVHYTLNENCSELQSSKEYSTPTI